MLPSSAIWGMASKAGRWVGQHSGLIGAGMFGIGTAGVLGPDRSWTTSIGEGLWGSLKGGIAGALVGGGFGAGLGLIKGGRIGALARKGAIIGGSLLGGIGAIREGLRSNRPVNPVRSRGWHFAGVHDINSPERDRRLKAHLSRRGYI